jgi:putative transposase
LHSNGLRTELVVDALEMALWRRPEAGLIHHTDRGAQYAALSFGKRLEEVDIVPSMGRVGSALDNAISESFVASLKTELLHRHRFLTREAARTAIFDYIEGRSYSQDLTARVPDVVAPEPDGVGGDTATDTSMP